MTKPERVAAMTLATVLWIGGRCTATDIPCPGDVDGDRRVTVAEVVLAVNQLLHGCPGTVVTPTRPPLPTATPGSIELQILQQIGHELVPSPNQFGCSARSLGAEPMVVADLTCELPTAFAFVSFKSFANAGAAEEAFDSRRGDAALLDFHGYDAFEERGIAIGNTPSLGLLWRVDRWVVESVQVTVFPNVLVYRDIAERVFTEAVARGLFPPDP